MLSEPDQLRKPLVNFPAGLHGKVCGDQFVESAVLTGGHVWGGAGVMQIFSLGLESVSPTSGTQTSYS